MILTDKLMHLALLTATLMTVGCGRDGSESPVCAQRSAQEHGEGAKGVHEVIVSNEVGKVVVETTNVVNKSVAPKKALPLQGTDVVLSVNELNVTRDEYVKYVDFLVRLYLNKNPKADDKAKRAMRSRIRQNVHKTLTQRLVIRSKVDLSQVQEKEGVRARLQREYLRSFATRSQTFEDLLTKVKELGVEKMFLDDFELDVKLNSHLETVYADRLAVTPERLEQVKKDVAEFNANASKLNAETEKLAESIIKRARSGEDFGKLADEFSKDPEKEAGGSLGECVASDFQDEPALWRAVVKLKAGEITELLETEDGYAIIRVNRILTPDESAYGETSYDLARIFLRRAYVFPDQTEEEFKADVVKETRDEVLKEFIVGLVKKSKIVYPRGKAALLK